MSAYRGIGIYDYETELTDGDRVYEQEAAASLLVPISEANVGYQLMLRMGWAPGTGLNGGKGRVDPVPFVHKADTTGVGKSEEVEEKHIESTKTRKALESEVLAAETDDQRVKREIQVEKANLIREEIKQVTRAFYCELCDKQYTRIHEYEAHLSSYDHGHKQRFKDMQEMSKRGSLPGTAGNKRAREDKEKAREEREFKRLQDAAMSKAGGNLPVSGALPARGENTFKSVSGTTTTQFSPVETLPSTVPQVNSPQPGAATSKVAFGFGMKKQTQPIKFSFGKK
ncbi:hypothetical protein HDU79_011058 [Rhizoclosmatium sp. JEL0117]|nr:hypothetical protein HDU79_011058 [Rhizoclosmatium sp. JEL0117]